MIQLLSTKYSRHIACILSSIFLCSLMPVFGRITRTRYPVAYRSAYTPSIKPVHNTIAAAPAAKIAAKPVAVAKKTAKKPFIGGPTQPEMSSFKSIGTDKMVNLFSGDFSYNIPLLDVGGYPVNLFYDGGINMEQEASWVGLGWNINPGTVSRNMRGIPDDFNGEDIMQQRQLMKPNKTWGVTLSGDLELAGVKNLLGISIGASVGVSFNNYLGPALDLGIKGGTSFRIAGKAGSEKTAVKLGVGLGTNINSRAGLSLSPNVSLTASSFANVKGLSTGVSLATSYNSRTGIKQLQISEQMSYNYTTQKKVGEDKDGKGMYVDGVSGSMGGRLAGTTISFAKPSYVPSIRMSLNNEAYAGHFQIGGGIFGVYGSAEMEVFTQKSSTATPDQTKPLVGYLYYQKAANNPNAVMDFTRLNDNEVTSNTPIISAPQYSYDVYTIQGEGTGGSIRPYRNDMGYVRDNTTRSKDNSLSIGADIGIPGHYGANFNTIKTPTIVGEWGSGNKLANALRFTSSSTSFENVYFRNPGETSVMLPDQLDLMGGIDLVRFKLGGTNASPTIEPMLEKFSKTNVPAGSLNISNILITGERKKRSQVTSFLTAEEAAIIGLDREIKSYSPSVLDANNMLVATAFPRVDGYRKKHHLSQINVIQPDGKRYVYGIPVYNIVQKDFSFTVTAAGTDEDKVSFAAGNEQNLNTDNGKDGFIQMTETPGYAHSFLLTGLMSTDYVDVTNNGISEDDLGDAVKFNYTRMAADHAWRTPHTSDGSPIANFNAGNRTETKDDKGIISYGKRESWYLHSIESKLMIALFTLEDRSDGKGPVNEVQGVNSGDNSLKRLKKIDLYNKTDLKKNGMANAKPVKTVWFSYSYSLCAGTPDNASGGGKLTLDSVYFTFNGKDRLNKSKFAFAYTNASGGNPSYAFNASDRWGSYKPKSQNPGGLKNGDYPYAIQNKTVIDQNAGAWALKKILLPSGGQVEVEYESDNYAFVQNKRAAAMMEIAGLGSSATSFSNKLFGVGTSGSSMGIVENDHVFITVPEACTTKTQVFQKYLAGVNQLAFKLSVNMPKGVEFINAYATIADYGVYDASRIWIRLNKVNDLSPLSLTALEYLRERLPGQAFPGYDVSESAGLKQVGEMLLGMLDALKSAFKDPVMYLRSQGKAQTINTANSFVRLNDPDGFKYGGGQRVRSVKMKDNWQAMTGQYTTEYGQVYDYTTTEVFNGVERTISSGVASYEPSIGGEENPFQSIVQVTNKLPMGPASYGAIEMPMLDAFFPAAGIGYSKVTVRSLNKNTDASKKSRSGIGKQVTEYFTAKDFPVYYNHTALDPASDKQDHQASLLGFFYKYAFDSRALSQGFIVETNDMHGKLKSEASYAEGDDKKRVNYTENFYRNTGSKGLNEKFDFVHANMGGRILDGNMGIDVELMTDAREFTVKSTSYEVQGQLDLFPVIIPFWLPFIWPVSGESENTYRAVTTTKVVNYHGVLDSTVVIDKGSQVSSKNLVYDAETGDVVISRSNNAYDKPLYTVKHPAYWAYSGMGLAYKNIDAVFTNQQFNDGKWVGSGYEQDVIESGDELYIVTAGTSSSSCYWNSSGVKRVWAFDKNKNNTSLTTSTRDIIYLDENAKPFSLNGVTFRIVRSGKRNMLAAQVASLTLMGNPVVTSGGVSTLTINSSSQVINAAAMEFREKWQTDNELFKKYEMVYNHSLCKYEEVVNCNGYLDKEINPYLTGLIGNFRIHRNLVFYGDRTGSIPTNLSQNGFLVNFQPYWNFDANYNLVPDVASTKWVWNVQSTRFNSKGLELETKDALNIYTAAQFGYHNTLTTAVVNNSRHDEMVFEGFEDNSFVEALNVGDVNPCAKKRANFTGFTNSQVINSETTSFGAHTGKHMLSVAANSTAQLQVPVTSSVVDTYKLHFQPGSVNLGGWQGTVQFNTMYRYCGTTFLDSVVDALTPALRYDYPFSFNGNNPCNNGALVPTFVMHFYFIPDVTGNYTINNTLPSPGGGATKVIVRADATPGVLNYNNFMTFQTTGNDRVYNHNTGNNVCPSGFPTQQTASNSQFMCAGKLYEVVLQYTPNTNTFSGSCLSTYVTLIMTSIGLQPQRPFFTKVQQVDNWCNFTKPMYAVDSMFNPAFTIPSQKKMLFSAWVREQCSNCAETGYINNQVKLVFNGGSSQTVIIQPAGPVIDGWQRMEGEFTPPAGATQMTVQLVNSTATAIYYDDIRIHPFSANMKSYVYDPVNLRLLAELDANNYASFYEYDEEGGLIRTKAETREGIKTISETRSFKQRTIKQLQ